MVELDGLTRNYGERAALEDVTLSLAADNTLVVFGPNGAGKTTLLRILATLLRPHAGEVTVLDARLPDEAWRVRGRVGLLGHEPLLYRELTPRENLRYHARLHGVPFERVEEQLHAVSMSERADEPVRTLSRGMVQRVAVARACVSARGPAPVARACGWPSPPSVPPPLRASARRGSAAGPSTATHQQSTA
jgi:heme exporter protein A